MPVAACAASHTKISGQGSVAAHSPCACAASHTKISGQGSVAAHSPSALKDAGGEALAAGDIVRATHMYTMAIDLVLEGEAPPASGADWFALDAKSGGVLHALLSNRSLTLLKQEDAPAAAEDAEHCTCARPDWPKGHLRLLAALDASFTLLEERRRAATAAAGKPAGRRAEEEEAEQIAATRRVAEDPGDPRRFMAAGDFGSALAVGAFGLQKDVAAAEVYLRVGADGGDAGAQRNLGLLLLELGRAAEGAEMLRRAAEGGDESAAATCDQLLSEAKAREEEALFKLRALASGGDSRARAVLEQHEAERAAVTARAGA
ncbi:hypothetical protein EMIHUDRAFT_98124 [Emiliania huxleyi CCMP1516]|uniref:Uncharacterized protein n=2 Tax=Emiliania huxleyi TaxID=2903 RepID=A0A0D3KLQ7_EMIH1|nr:hypothetical protein EMIHUDRAFT_98124 [Emiliania huxleyi CCMP1516]EOD36692.1 hypothetical protein EMIHUDRAFT_98124 [Emiliania huxleyi CCMP1516]|eukprot:XP_005789121.1 hypothetical protein EMIHUDRAFT_98124 [Emiliania huxleyi CCMP1516]